MRDILIQGIRPKTLVAAFIPPAVALALAYKEFEYKRFDVFILCVLLAVCIQIATNLYNDGIDFKKGADEDRDGPRRVTNKNNIRQVFYLGHFFIALAFLCGIPLVMIGGIPFLVLGGISLLLSYGYTGGPFPLAYLGLGELFVFLFFGLLAVMGSFYLMIGEVTVLSFLLGSMIGLQSCTLIAINNLRDRDKDRLVNKNTLATKMTGYRYKKLLDFFVFFPYIILFYFVCFVDLRFVFCLLSVTFAQRLAHQYKNYKENYELNNSLALAGKNLLSFGILFILACL